MAAGSVRAAALRLEDSQSGELLRCIALGTREFSLSFVHSVSLTPVEDFYRLTHAASGRTRMIQTAERFITHGQGLPSMEKEPDAEGFESDNNRFVVHLHRPIDDLVVRLDTRFKNRLHTDRVSSTSINGRTLPDCVLCPIPLVIKENVCPRTKRSNKGSSPHMDINAEKIDALVQEFDDASHFRDVRGLLKIFVTTVCVALSLFHIYTAGFGILNEISHRTVHMAFVMGILFLVIPRRKPQSSFTGLMLGVAYGAFYMVIATQLVSAFSSQLPMAWTYGVYGLAGILALSALPLKIWGDTAIGLDLLMDVSLFSAPDFLDTLPTSSKIFLLQHWIPQPLDYLMGGIAIILVLEGARRTLGESLSVMLSSLFCMLCPDLCCQASWRTAGMTLRA